MRWHNRAFLALIFAAVGVGFAGGTIARIGYVFCAFAAATVAVSWVIDRRNDPRRWWARAVNPIVLESPFRTTWRVVAGGPDPRHNHHLAAGEQYFAYDFAPIEGEAWDAEILAPCDGTVAWTEDRRDDAQNYVSIETHGGFVILKDLRKGTFTVRLAQDVRAGAPLARCGKRLHVHAQNRPQLGSGIAEAIPIGFYDERARALILEYGDVLAPVRLVAPD